MAERKRPTIELPETMDRGVSLRVLIPFAESSYKGNGPRASEKVYWLADAMETPDFWNELHGHLIQDTKVRQSVGGMFSGDPGEKPIGPYDWYHLFDSLDNFLQKFDARATEFLFRDFRPETRDPFLSNRINAARVVALDKYPRLRRLYWDDYKDVLEIPTFWEAMIIDLQRVKKPVTSTAFFDKRATPYDRMDLAHLGTEMERLMMRRLVHQAGDLSQRAQQIDYRSFSQIIRGLIQQNPRTFFLNFNPAKQDPLVEGLIAQAKVLIKEKVKPIRKNRERILMITRDQLDRETSTPQFWRELARDFDQYSSSDTLTYNLDTFLRFYDPDENGVVQSRLGKYAYVTTAFAPRRIKGSMQSVLKDPSKEASFYLMWGVEQTEQVKDEMLDAKRLAVELFPNDCLYVSLQLPEFWEKFQDDVQNFSVGATLASFLRYYSADNPTASRGKHKKGEGDYFRFYYRADYDPEQVARICQQLELPVSDDFKDNLRTLFLHLAPGSVQSLMVGRFPKDFNPQKIEERQQNRRLLDEAKKFLAGLAVGVPSTLTFETADEAERFRTRIESASRSLRFPILTRTLDNGFIVTRAEKKRWDANEVIERDAKVKELRQQGLLIAEIAERLGVPDHLVESSVTRLVRRKEVQPRKPFGRE